MARLNIEDSLFGDERFLDLTLDLGDKDTAAGLMLYAWRLAQKHWLEHKSIPKNAWPDRFNILIKFGLAKQLESGNFYICGSKDQFLWLERQSSAGKASANKRRLPTDLSTENTPIVPDPTAVNLGSTSEYLSEALTLSLSQEREVLLRNTPASPKISASRKHYVKQTLFIGSEKDIQEIIPENVIQRWIGLYPAVEFIPREFTKAVVWLSANPQKNNKTRRGWIVFFSGWLDRGWSSRQKGLPSVKAVPALKDCGL